MLSGLLAHDVVEQAMPTRAFFDGHAVAREIGPDRQNLPVYPLPFHLVPAFLQIEELGEKGTDRQPVDEMDALPSPGGLDQFGAVWGRIVLQDRQDFGRDIVRMYIDVHANSFNDATPSEHSAVRFAVTETPLPPAAVLVTPYHLRGLIVTSSPARG